MIEPLCPFGELLDRSALGDANADDRARLADHVAGGCPTCSPRFEAQARFERLLEGAFKPLEQHAESRRRSVLDRVAQEVEREEDRRARKLMIRRTVRFGFTTIILVTVLFLPLAYIGFVTISNRLKAKLQAATATVEERALAVALVAYYYDHKSLPEGEADLVRALSSERAGHGRPYFPFDPARVREGRFLDPFGRPYSYQRLDPKHARITSLGPNGRDEQGVGDDISQDVVIVR